ncbi:MAG TPA: UDP-glucose 4-epimerase GalE [Polyangiaceae bacterium]|nr:UDP-glucose 4-epimerase GalE [Polyangiaceae bacterium]
MQVLVTGAAGYIGSHALRALARAGHGAIALDNLSRGHRAAVLADVPFYELDVRETDKVEALLRERRVDCVMHFAALTYVGESVSEPLKYYDNNTGGTLSILKAVERAEVSRLVFSSTCATYGEPKDVPIREETPQSPISPYGWSKLLSEYMLRDYAAKSANFGYAALRYFNVAGCAADGAIGEDHDPETHLIPVVLQAVLGKREKITVFGEDYPTPDGTCIRDYIHVEDLVEAHVRVMEALAPGDRRIYNLGIGKGYSVKEIIDAVRRVVGQPFRVDIGPRRPGDPPELYADPSKIERELGWRAQRTDIAETILSAWRWMSARPDGYGK